MENHYNIAIIGAGTGGIMLAAQLNAKHPSIKVGIIDPAEFHYYQPAWTLVGAGTYDYEKTKRPMKAIVPKNLLGLKMQ